MESNIGIIGRSYLIGPVLQQHEGLIILNRSQMTKMTPELAAPSPNFRTIPTEGQLAPTDLTCTRPAYTAAPRQNQALNSPAPKSRLYHQGIAALH
ncbi:hypothetical protein AVEN_93839-1 [Araneus ventricosus]|uniref:Uncharacterized protein n=1 Tax=Araneus ventricosus TaxID=182803 RepID=A0A4Y2B0J3_ARAVE|nr:hypothetical protein AVEN_93839-1 [Araneus ventricosus]